jgi:hypothetical protein
LNIFIKRNRNSKYIAVRGMRISLGRPPDCLVKGYSMPRNDMISRKERRPRRPRRIGACGKVHFAG